MIRIYSCIQKKENYKTRHTSKSYFSWPNTITLGWRHRFVLQIRLIWNQNWDYLPDIKVGKGEERAINKVIKHAFKNPVHLLCTKHLKDNVHRYRFLYDKEGCSSKDGEFVLCMFLIQSKTDAATFNLGIVSLFKVHRTALVLSLSAHHRHPQTGSEFFIFTTQYREFWWCS